MPNCPNDGRALENSAEWLVCPQCGGAAIDPQDLRRRAPQIARTLALETNPRSEGFASQRRCPRCEGPTAPWRLGALPAWLDRCPACELFWVERQHRRTVLLENPKRPAPAPGAGVRPAPPAWRSTELTGFQTVLSWFGFPIVLGAEGDHPPILTVTLCAFLFILFVFARISGDPTLGVEGLGLISGEASVLGAFTANLVHFGWLHLLGNAYFLVSFGIGLEQKVPRWAFLVAFFGLGTLSVAIEAALAEPGLLIGGASGAVAVVMGACFVVQPRARVLVSLAAVLSPLYLVIRLVSKVASGDSLEPPAFRVPIWVYGVFELGFQLFMLLIGVPGVAWVAHLSGLAMGITLGFTARALWPVNPRLRSGI